VHKVESAGSTEMVEIGDFTIDTAERTASLLGEDLRLTSEECDVLMFLTTILSGALHREPYWRRVGPKKDSIKPSF
jgi:DNA-binding response OmpR family regulator